MSQSPGSRRSRRGYTGRAVTSNGITAETHVHNHVPEPVDTLQVAREIAQRAVNNTWVNSMPDPNVSDFTYVDTASIPQAIEPGLWHQLQARYKGYFAGTDSISEENLVKIKNAKALVLTGMVKVPVSIHFDSSIKGFLKGFPTNPNLDNVELRTLFPNVQVRIDDSVVYVRDLSNITISHRDEASGLKFESEPVSPNLDLQMIVSFIEELDVETQKALKAHLLSQVKF